MRGRQGGVEGGRGGKGVKGDMCKCDGFVREDSSSPPESGRLLQHFSSHGFSNRALRDASNAPFIPPTPRVPARAPRVAGWVRGWAVRITATVLRGR